MISIQTNVASLLGEVNYNTVQSEEQNTIEQLTSGYRINSSADDAAGLAIANSLQSEQTELTQGVANANDGVSQLQIIDGGLTNISSILDTLKTLATEAASTTFTGDFNTLNNEFQTDLAELNRQASNIGLNTGGQFNENLAVYVGGGIGNQNGAQIGQAIENINLGNATVTVASIASSTAVTITGIGGSYATFSASIYASTASVSAAYYSATSAGNATSSAAGGQTGYTATGSNAVSQLIGTSSIASSSVSVTATGYFATSGSYTNAANTVTFNGNSGFSATASTAAVTATYWAGSAGSYTNASESSSGAGGVTGYTGSVSTASVGATGYTTNAVGATTQIYYGQVGYTTNAVGATTQIYGTSSQAVTSQAIGTASAVQGSVNIGTSSFSALSTASVSASGYAISGQATAPTITFVGQGGYSATNATATSLLGIASSSAVTGSSSYNYTQTQGTMASVAAITATYFNSVDAYSLGLATGTAASGATNIAVTDVTSAQAAIALVAQAVINLGTVQGAVGAGINQLNFAIGLAQSQVTNYASDQSQIRDADVATDASNLSKYQVLSQAGIAALAQANQMPQAVLKLLQ